MPSPTSDRAVLSNGQISNGFPASSSSSTSSSSVPPPPPANQGRRGSAASNTAAANSLFTSGPFGVDAPPLRRVSERDDDDDYEGDNDRAPEDDLSPEEEGTRSFPPSASQMHPAFPPGFSAGRRTSVSAESLVPSATVNGVGGHAVATKPSLPVYPKTPQQLARIRHSIQSNFLFKNLEDEQERDVLNAMKELVVQSGDKVIEEGAVGDFFYVVEEGSLDVYIRNASSGPSELGDKVFTNTPGTSFGELALMYNAPRSASIVATTRCTLWALDRVTFRTILLDHTSTKRKLYESFLATIPILSALEPHERAKIADALESRTYEAGEAVVEQGEVGEEFFIIESGRAEITKQIRGASGEIEDTVVAEYGKGDYFGGKFLSRSPHAESD